MMTGNNLLDGDTRRRKPPALAGLGQRPAGLRWRDDDRLAGGV